LFFYSLICRGLLNKRFLTKGELYMMTQKQKLRRAFNNGAVLTTKQIRNLYRIASPTKVISQLRLEDGFPVHSVQTVTSRGETVVKYRTGRPGPRVVAAGYRAISLGLA
jgi:hypothetical protein